MDDIRVWSFERSLWTGDAHHIAAAVDEQCVIVIPFPPFVMTGQQAVQVVADTPRWRKVTFEHGRICRPQEGLIVVVYHVTARRAEGEDYSCWCSTTYRRLAHEEWRVVQHQQTLPHEDVAPVG